jgi:hypothetical protein
VQEHYTSSVLPNLLVVLILLQTFLLPQLAFSVSGG